MAEYRQWREEKRTYLKDVVPLETPYNVKVEVSSLCNAKCVYCAHSKPNHGVWEGNMSMGLFEKVINDLKQFPEKPKQMETYMFGEPLCNPLLPKMISLAKSEDVVDRITFTTNGLLLTPERVDALMETEGIDIIRISLQGLDAQTYYTTCGVKIDFERFLSNLKYLYDHKGKCSIRMKIADLALEGVENGKEKFESLFGDKADSIFIEHILPLYGDVDYDKIDERIKDTVMNGRENVATYCIHKVCHRPFFRVRVAANGLVTSACCDTPHDIIYGDITTERLYDIWNGEKHRAFLKMQLEGKRFMHPSCKECVAANDITTEADLLDPWAEEILGRF
ncbi:MAG: radical SAM protein [Lachnospiraceae bacterium]|nr:radical SAM protein [Lachnospiraceae bacterium]